MKREIQDASHLRRSMKIFGEQKSIFVGCRTQLSRLRDGKMNAKVPKFTFVHFKVARMKPCLYCRKPAFAYLDDERPFCAEHYITFFPTSASSGSPPDESAASLTGPDTRSDGVARNSGEV